MVIQIQKLLLIMARITAFIGKVPGFSFKGLPNTFKVGLSLTFSIIVYSLTPNIPVESSIVLFFIYLAKEVLFGLALGYIVDLVFGAVEIAGQLVDFQSGFSMGNVFDPSMGTQASYYGRIYHWILLSLFFIFNMHHYLIESIINSFQIVPIGAVDFANFNILGVLVLFSRVFEIGFNLAAPMVIIVLLTDIVLGIISKSVPQINVLMLGMPIKAMVGFALSLVMMSWLMNSLTDILYLIPDYIEKFYNIL